MKKPQWMTRIKPAWYFIRSGKSAWDDYWYGAGPGADTASGKVVDADIAQNCSTVLACLRVLTEGIAMLPLSVFQMTPNGNHSRAPDHPLHRLLHIAPNPEQTKFTWLEHVMLDLPLWGWSYTQIVRSRGGRVLSLWPLRASRITRKRNERGELVFVLQKDSGQDRVFHRDEILAICGPMGGKSLIRLAKESIGVSLAMEERGAKFFANDARPGGYLKVVGKLSKDSRDQLGQAWTAAHRGSSRAHKTAVLEEDTEWKTVEVSNSDAEFLASRKFQRSDIAGWFRVPPHMIADLERSTNNNIEHQGLEFTTHTMGPWLARIEEALKQSFFPTGRYYPKFNVNALLRGDSAARAAYYRTMVSSGLMNRNEVRALEELNKMPGKQGNMFTVQSAMVDLDLIAEQGTAAGPPPTSVPTKPTLEPDESPDEEPAEAAAREQRARILKRGSPDGRLALRDAHYEAFRTMGEVVVKADIADLRKQLSVVQVGRSVQRDATDDFKTWLYDYYEGRLGKIAKDAREVFAKYAKEVGKAAADEIEDEIPELGDFIDDYADGFATRHIIKSRAQLKGLETIEDIERRLDLWEEERPDAIANKEVVLLAAAVAAAVFFAGGYRIIWRTQPGACPLCLRMQGLAVGKGQDFLPEGATVDPGDDTTAPLKVHTTIAHEPLHNGCRCYTAPTT